MKSAGGSLTMGAKYAVPRPLHQDRKMVGKVCYFVMEPLDVAVTKIPCFQILETLGFCRKSTDVINLSEYLACKEGKGAVMNLDRAVYQRIGDMMRQIGVRPDAKAFADDVNRARKAWEDGDLPEAVRLMEEIERKLASKHY